MKSFLFNCKRILGNLAREIRCFIGQFRIFKRLNWLEKRLGEVEIKNTFLEEVVFKEGISTAEKPNQIGDELSKYGSKDGSNYD